MVGPATITLSAASRVSEATLPACFAGTPTGQVQSCCTPEQRASQERDAVGSRNLQGARPNSMPNTATDKGPIHELKAAWAAVRGRKRPNADPQGRQSDSGAREVVVAPLFRWAIGFTEPDRPTLLTIPGATIEDREALLRSYLDPRYASVRPDVVEDVCGDQVRGWLDRGALASLTERVATMKVPPGTRHDFNLDALVAPEWELLWSLIVVDTLIVEEPLRSLVDHSSDPISAVHKALWEARFLFREHPTLDPAATFVETMVRWMTGAELKDDDIERLTLAGIHRRIERDSEKLDVLCFILTLAAQNGAVTRTIFLFDAVESALRPECRPMLRQLLGVLRIADRWVRMGGSPIGFFLGFNATPENRARLRKLNAALADRVEAGLAWG